MATATGTPREQESTVKKSWTRLSHPSSGSPPAGTEQIDHHIAHHLRRRRRDRTISPMHSHLVAASGEFVGTFFFLWMSYSASLMVLDQQSATALNGGGSSTDTVVYIALVYGFSLLVNAWAFYRISGGLFNPAVSVGLSICGAMEWTRTAFLVPAQLAASMVAGGLVKVMFAGDISNANTTLGPGTSVVQGLFIETILTAQLIFVILMLAAEKSKGTFLAPIGIGLALFVAELSGVYSTGGSLNPARSFGCAVASTKFPSYHWIYWLGPLFGAALAASYYRLVKWARYEEVNPDQDSAGTDIEEGTP